MNKYDYIVCGAGLTGCTFARQKAEAGHTVLIYDRRTTLGGNAHDRRFEENPEIFVHTYGPHLFHTNSDRVLSFLSQFTEWRPYEHRVQARLTIREDEFGPAPPLVYEVPLPFNFTSIRTVFSEEFAEDIIRILRQHFKDNERFTLARLRQIDTQETRYLHEWVYKHVFANYTQKMWNRSLEELGPTVSDRVPLIAGTDDRYFADKHQCLPLEGYTAMIQRMVNHKNITVELGLSTVPFQVWAQEPTPKVLYTGPIDEFFNYRFGRLPYRSLRIKHDRVKTKFRGKPLSRMGYFMDKVGTCNYPAHPFQTRCSSMVVISGLKDLEIDVIVSEEPCTDNDNPYYPVPTHEGRELYHKYAEMAEELKSNTRFAGRLGSFQYLNMDQAVAQALKIAEEF